MNMQRTINSNLDTLKSKLEQLQGIPIWELKAKAHAIAADYPDCTITGPELVKGSFVIEVSDANTKTPTTHRLPPNYSNEW